MRVIFDGVATASWDGFGDAAVVARPERALREPRSELPGLDGLPGTMLYWNEHFVP